MGLQLQHRLRLFLGQQLGLVAVRADQFGHQRGLGIHVAGQKLDVADAVVPQAVHRAAHVFPRAVHGKQHAHDLVIYAHVVGDGPAGLRQGMPGGYPVLSHELQVAHAHGSALHLGAAPPGDLGDHLAVGGDLHTLLRAVGQDRAGQRMGTGLLGGHGQGQHFLFIHVTHKYLSGYHLRPALGDGAGLVQQHRVGLAHLLDVRAALDEDALLHRRIDGRGEGCGRGQLDAAGVVDHQHLEGLLWIAGRQTDRQAQQEVQRHQVVGKAVRVALYGRLLELAGLHHAHDAGNHRLIAHLAGLDADVAVLDHRTGEHFVALVAFHRDELAGDGALVHHRGAGAHRAIHRDLLPGVRLDEVARPGFGNGTPLQAAITLHPPHAAVLHGEHLLDGGARLLDGIGGHHLRQVGQRQDHQR